jgi:hypothetical protein
LIVELSIPASVIPLLNRARGGFDRLKSFSLEFRDTCPEEASSEALEIAPALKIVSINLNLPSLGPMVFPTAMDLTQLRLPWRQLVELHIDSFTLNLEHTLAVVAQCRSLTILTILMLEFGYALMHGVALSGFPALEDVLTLKELLIWDSQLLPLLLPAVRFPSLTRLYTSSVEGDNIATFRAFHSPCQNTLTGLRVLVSDSPRLLKPRPLQNDYIPSLHFCEWFQRSRPPRVALGIEDADRSVV